MRRRGAFQSARLGVAATLSVAALAITARPAASAPPIDFASPPLVSAVPRFDAEFVALLTHRGARRHPFADASGRLPLVLEVPEGADASALGWLPLAPGFATLRVDPAELPRFVALHPDAHFSMWPGLHPVLDASAKLNRVNAYRAALAAQGSPLAGTGKGVVVGIVDTGVDAAHEDLRDATGGTRIAWLLDFSHPPNGRHGNVEQAFGCTSTTQSPCAVLDKSEIDRALSGDRSVALPGDALGHGTHVTSIAAGNGGAAARFVGGAPEATLIVASVAHGDAADTLDDVDIVTSTRFIFDRAEKMGLPAVVNLSLGGDFGPHDGTTPIEQSLAALVGPAHPGRSIVVAAGNSGALYRGDEDGQVLGIHTESRVTEGVPARINVLTPDASKASPVSGSVFVWVTYRATDAISIGLVGPNGLSINPIGVGQKAGFRSSDDSLNAAIYNGVFSGESPLPPSSHGAVIVWDGQWPHDGKMTLELEGEGFVNAWVEATFDDATASGPVYFDLATRAATINVPASHPDLIAVGCTINRSQWVDSDSIAHDLATTAYSALSPPDGSCYFSSAGPTATGASKPDISAPGAMVAAAMSGDAVPGIAPFSAFAAPVGLCPDGNECLVVDSDHALLSGTSMSSPQVAGAVALLFERDPQLVQSDILRTLQSGARRPVGPITADYLLGVGALDVVGAMAALDAQKSGLVRDPDAPASWLALADNYLHPGGPALIGTVEVRAADGSLADGFDEKRLTLELGEEGAVERPLTREAPGLYRFAVSAAPSTGSRVLRLDVKVDGVTVGSPDTRVYGHRLVAIGADRWIASGSARMYGGCSVSARSRVANGDASALWALALATAIFASRRRTS